MTTSSVSHSYPLAYHHDDDDDEWLQITPGEWCVFRATVQQTKGSYTMLEVILDAGNGVPMHIHREEDEHFIILEGELYVANGNTALNATAGMTVTVSRGVPHAWCNISGARVRMLVIYSPGRIEGLFRDIIAQRYDEATFDKYGYLMVGPALLEGICTFDSPRN